MDKKKCQKYITVTAVAMCILMLVYVATTFITVDVRDYSTEMLSSDFINDIIGNDIKLNNESYNIKEVECTVLETGETLDFSQFKGSESEIKFALIDEMGYNVVSEETKKNGDSVITISSDSDKNFDLSWKAYNTPAELMWFPKHTSTRDFLRKIQKTYYDENDVPYAINAVVLFPVVMFVLGLAAAAISLFLRKIGLLLVFPLSWSVIGIITHIAGFVGSTASHLYICTVLKSLSPVIFTIQFVITLLVLALAVISILCRKKIAKIEVEEEAEFYANLL